MKVRITGASNFINRMFEACGQYQWAREFLRNSIEAEATRVEFGIEWQAVERRGVYRRTIADDGLGMNADQLLEFFSTLGAGAKRIGSIHENFGVGAKIAALPWNPEGVVVISYQAGKASMIWIMLEPESGEYELVEFDVGDGSSCVIDPSQFVWEAQGIDWSAIKPDWLEEHGTVIVLLGSEEQPDTVLGNPAAGESSIKGLSVYLNSRFWDLSERSVTVVELRSEKKNSWPIGPSDRDDTRRPNNRTIKGASFYLTEVKASKGQLCAADLMEIDQERVQLEWYLWAGERPNVDSYAKKGGYIAVRYDGELYHLTSHKVHFRWFGVIESQVQQNLTIIIEPPHYRASDGRWGVHPDQSRNRLIFTGNGEKGIDLPMSDWGQQFTEDMPEAVLAAIRASRGELEGTIEDEEYRKRLQDKFGSRWTMKALVIPVKRADKSIAVSETTDQVDATQEIEEPIPESQRPKRRRRKTRLVLQRKAVEGGADGGVEREIAVDVPRFAFGHKDDFEKPWHLAMWAPTTPSGPTVKINIDSPILEEIVKYHQERYPDIFAEEVQKTIHHVFGEVAACKIAHSQRLRREHIPDQQIDTEYRNEAALTIGLMGLLAEESLIAQRLGRLGKKKTA